MKVSNETKIGSLTAIAIVILILGYNFMASEGDMFKPKRTFYAAYSNASGLTKGNRILMDGYKIGYVKSIDYDPKRRKTIVGFKITEIVEITKESIAKIISIDAFGTRAIAIEYFPSIHLLNNGDTLQSETEPSMTESISKVLSPIADKTEHVLNYLDSFLNKTDKLNNTFDNLNKALVSFTETSDRTNKLINQNSDAISETLNNIHQLSKSLKSNQDNINNIIKNTESFSNELKSIEMEKLSKQLNELLVNLNAITEKINTGEGSAAKLVNDPQVYDNLNQSLTELNKLLQDINKYPEKYIPMPWGKKQRKKAKSKSADEEYNK